MMRPVVTRQALGALALVGAVILVPVAASAQAESPSPTAPTVDGEVTGSLEAGSQLAFTVDATMPGGWEALHLVEIVVRSGGQELERISYDIEDVHIKVGAQEIVAGTGALAAGDYLRVSGSDVVLTTGGGNLSFHVTAEVLEALPEDVRFELGVQDDFGTPTSVTVGLSEPPPEGLTWSTVIAAILVALLAGGMVGNVFAAKRRPTARFSVYGTIDRRLRSERESTSGG